MLTSIIEMPLASRSRIANFAYSSTVLPAIDTTARAPCSINQGRSRSTKISIPGPCSPIEFNIPLGVSAIRGVARPDRTFIMMDFVTMPPSSATSKNCASSWPAAAQPDAVSIGFGSSNRPNVVAMSTVLATLITGVAVRTVRVIGSPRRGPCGESNFAPALSLPAAPTHRARQRESCRHRRSGLGHHGTPDRRRTSEPCG